MKKKYNLLYSLRIGLANDAISSLEKHYPVQMKNYLRKLCLSRVRGGQPGLNFSGKQLDKIYRNLDLLERFNPRIAPGEPNTLRIYFMELSTSMKKTIQSCLGRFWSRSKWKERRDVMVRSDHSSYQRV